MAAPRDSEDWAGWLLARALDFPSEKDDPRTGSARNDSTEPGTLSSAGNKTSSAAKLGATFIPVVIYMTVCLLLFIVLRTRCKRVYAPRTIAGLQLPRAPTPELPSGLINWIIPFFKTPDTFVLNHGSIDGFFFLRYLKVLRNIAMGGCLITYPILLPINATGKNGQEQLDALTIGNVKDQRKLYAHVAVAWVFFGFVLFTVVRECIYYVNLRQAYLSSPSYADRLSSRTMLVTCVPEQYLDERRLRKIFGDSAKRIWVPRTNQSLANLVKEREQTALRLEKAEIQLIKKTNLARKKYLRKNPLPELSREESVATEKAVLPRSTSSDVEKRISNDETETQVDEYTHPYGLDSSLPDVRGSVAALWIPAEARPYHRPIANYGRRIDTIRHTRLRLKELNLEIFKLRRVIRRGDGTALPAAFIEFDTQTAAQAAQQTLIHHRPMQMSHRVLDIRPDEVLWDSLRMSWWERIVRRTLIMALIVAAIVFWSIPSAFVGIVSNVDFLAGLAPLKWITKLPKPILGFLGGFIPAMALSLFMSLVPAMLRFCAAQAGVPSLIAAELFCQRAYFAFQIIQVFLITTLTSAASAAFYTVLKNPMLATDLLAQNLPRASNFYLSYIMIQCLAAGGSHMLHLLDLLRHTVLVRVIGVPRAQYKLWHGLRPVHWGGVFPVFTNMGVIALAYACIAPLVLIFAAGGMAFMHVVWRYNLIYVYDSDSDSKGLFYPQALTQLIVGLYTAEICLIGLFALNKAFGPMVLTILLLVVSGIVHITLSDAIGPLVQSLPQTLSHEEDIREEELAKENADASDATPTGGASNSYYDTEQAFGEETLGYGHYGALEEEEAELESPDNHQINGSRGVEGGRSLFTAIADALKIGTRERIETEAEDAGLTRILRKLGLISPTDKEHPPSWLAKWLHPEVYEDFLALRKLIPEDAKHYDDMQGRRADYLPPELWMPKPTLWIPRDEARVSRQEVAHTRECVKISDLGARLDEKGRVVVDVENAPFEDKRLVI